MTLEERIQKLELELRHTKRQKRLTWGFAAFVIILMAVMVFPQGEGTAQGNTVPEIRAGQIVLVDENGEMRSLLRIDADGVRLSLYDENGTPRAGLFVGKDGPKPTFFD